MATSASGAAGGQASLLRSQLLSQKRLLSLWLLSLRMQSSTSTLATHPMHAKMHHLKHPSGARHRQLWLAGDSSVACLRL